MESLAREFDGQVQFVKVNIDRDELIRERLDLSGLPSYVVYRDGVEVDRLGIIPWWVEWRIRRMLSSAVASD